MFQSIKYIGYSWELDHQDELEFIVVDDQIKTKVFVRPQLQHGWSALVAIEKYYISKNFTAPQIAKQMLLFIQYDLNYSYWKLDAAIDFFKETSPILWTKYGPHIEKLLIFS